MDTTYSTVTLSPGNTPTSESSCQIAYRPNPQICRVGIVDAIEAYEATREGWSYKVKHGWGSEEDAELEEITDLHEAYEAKRWLEARSLEERLGWAHLQSVYAMLTKCLEAPPLVRHLHKSVIRDCKAFCTARSPQRARAPQ